MADCPYALWSIGFSAFTADITFGTLWDWVPLNLKLSLLHGNQCSEPIHSQDDVELNHVNDYQRYLKLAFRYYYRSLTDSLLSHHYRASWSRHCETIL